MKMLWNDYREFILKRALMDIVDELKAFVATARTGSFTCLLYTSDAADD